LILAKLKTTRLTNSNINEKCLVNLPLNTLGNTKINSVEVVNMEPMPLTPEGRIFIATVLIFSLGLVMGALEVGKESRLMEDILFVLNAGLILVPVVYMRMTNTYDGMTAILSYLLAALYLLPVLVDLIFFVLEKLARDRND
jgi:hypothetical protein